MGRILVEWTTAQDWFPAVTPNASDVSRTWARNEIGTASITFPLTTPYLWSIIQWGNILRIHEYGLPAWVGLANEREWSPDGVTLQLKSAEWLLSKSIVGQGLAFPVGTPNGRIAYGLFASANGNRLYKSLKQGAFDATRPRFVEPYNYADCWAELKKLADEDGAEVWVDENLFVHFRDHRGSDKSASIKLREGKHLVGVRLHETIEETVTKGIALGKGDSIVSKPKKSTSINADLGYERMDVFSFDAIDTAEGLVEPLLQAIRDRAYPKLTVDADFIKVPTTAAPDGEYWGAFGIGDTVELLLTSYVTDTNQFHYNGYARVVGQEIGGEDQMRLILEVVPQSTENLPFIAWTPGNAAI